jgi:hypothetical protein
MRAIIGPALAATLLCACTGGSEPLDAEKATAGCTSAEFPATGRADVCEVYERIEAAIAANATVVLPTIKLNSTLGADTFGDPQDLELRLTHSKVLAPDAFFEINGLPAEKPFMRAYEGHVEGLPANITHVLVSEDFIRGAVRMGDDMNLIRIAMKGNRPLDMPRRPADPSPAPAKKPPQSPEPSGCPTDMFLNVAEVRAVPPYISPMTGVGPADKPLLKSRVILDADYKAIWLWGERHMPAMMVGMLMEMDLTYRYEVGVRHTIVGVHLNKIQNFYQDTTPSAPFPEMMRWWDGHHAGERDVVHLYSGYDTGYAQANCIGSIGTTAGYSFSPIPWEDQNGWFHQNVLAHELGHLYSAHHHYGNHAESHLATIMIQGYTPGVQPQFGSLERTVIRGWAEEYLPAWE